MKYQSKGFTLLELMIVVGIIATLAAIAIPNLMQSKIASNEASAQRSLLAIRTAQELYHRRNNRYTEDFTNLYTDNYLVQSDLNLTNAINGVANATAKSGYCFASNDNYDGDTFMVVGVPLRPMITGEYMMFVDVNATVYRLELTEDDDPDDLVSEWTDGDDDWNTDLWEAVPN